MSALGDILSSGGDTAKQFFLWGVLYAIINQAAQPYMRELGYLTNEHDPNVVLSPADLADMVVRGIKAQADAAADAKKSGVDNAEFDFLVQATGEPPALQELLELFRRNFIDQDRLDHGIRQSRIKDEWIPDVHNLRFSLLGPADYVAAAVEQQLPYDVLQQLATISGLAPPEMTPGNVDLFRMLYNTRGRPPGPGELGDAANRGFIPWEGVGPDQLTFEQGIAESDVKTKWTGILRQLAAYLPPPRTITALLKEDAISEADARTLFEQSGLPPILADAYVRSATIQKIAVDKDLAKGEITALYADQAIDRPTAIQLLDLIGYRGAAADFLLQLTDLTVERKYVELAISRIASLFIGHKIQEDSARNALNLLGIPSGQVDVLMQTWILEAAANVKTLTPGEIASALYYKVLDQPTAMAELAQLGYTPHDAWVVLSNRVHGPLENEPPLGDLTPNPLPSQ